MPFVRAFLSRLLNALFRRGLSLPVHDLSSGFRLYKAAVVRSISCSSRDFDILEEILIRTHAEGWRICEVPFHYASRVRGSSKAKLLRFGLSYGKTFVRMWKLRNSIFSADYDDRAFDSVIPVQRCWQRRRYHIITSLAQGAGAILDIGCGSSRILRDLEGAIGVDISLGKARYMRRQGKTVINASAFGLPFRNGQFDCVICSQVIEHLPPGMEPFHEMTRVLCKGGRLILGTPDYGRMSWRIIERLYKVLIPGGYADEHITHYTRASVVRLVEGLGLHLEDVFYILRSEMILSFCKE